MENSKPIGTPAILEDRRKDRGPGHRPGRVPETYQKSHLPLNCDSSWILALQLLKQGEL